MVRITPQELMVLSKFIFDISGISLSDKKAYLLETRLQQLLGETCSGNFSELYHKIKTDLQGGLRQKLIDAVSTNETLFFRDTVPFDLMKSKIVPDLIDLRESDMVNGKIPLRIWSAACSTGQEVYSIAITLLDMLPNRDMFDITILGTDISSRAIAQASYGLYNKFEIERGMPKNILGKYFTQMSDGWRIRDEVRVLANFKQFNLMQPFYSIGPFDIVFCRNVAIYFSQAEKVKLFQKIARVLNPHGSLLVGGSESLTGFAPQFVARKYLRGIFYQTVDKPEERQDSVQSANVKEPVLKRGLAAARKQDLPAIQPVKSRPEKVTVQRTVSARPLPPAAPQPAPAEKPGPQRSKEERQNVDVFGPSVQKQPEADNTGGMVSKQKDARKSLLSSLRQGGKNDTFPLLSCKKSSDRKGSSLLGSLAEKKKSKRKS